MTQITPKAEWMTPALAQDVATVVFGLFFLASLYYMIRMSQREKSMFPITLFLGAGLAIFYEPISDVLGLVAYPHEGQRTLIRVLDRSIPVYIWLLFFPYFSVSIFYIMRRIDEGSVVAAVRGVRGDGGYDRAYSDPFRTLGLLRRTPAAALSGLPGLVVVCEPVLGLRYGDATPLPETICSERSICRSVHSPNAYVDLRDARIRISFGVYCVKRDHKHFHHDCRSIRFHRHSDCNGVDVW